MTQQETIYACPKFALGDDVTSKYTGFPGNGRIMGYILGAAYYANAKHINFIKWDTKFPNWKDKFLYYIWYKEPRKIVTKEEIKLSTGLDGFELDDCFEKQPLYQLITYPEDDLEIFE